jgi:hypothetical protein
MLFLGTSATPAQGTNEKVKILSNNILGMYVSFNEFLKYAATPKSGEIVSNNPFTEMIMTVGSKSGEATISTKNQNENTLKSLMLFANQMYLEDKKQKNGN